MRTLVIFLSLGLFFLTGMVIGMDQDKTQTIEKEPSIEETKNSRNSPDTDEKKVMIEQSVSEKDTEKMTDSPDHMTQKMAAFLESGIKGFYDLFVNIMYNLVQVFF